MAKLEKRLTLFYIFSIAAGVMISAGLFILPGIAYSMTGPSIVLSYLIAGIFAMFGMLAQAELASAMPKAGGTYYYVTRSMGPAVGTVYGIITWLALCLKSAFALVGIGTIISTITDINPSPFIIGICAAFVIINLVGVELAGRLQSILVLIILSVLFLFIGSGLPKLDITKFTPFTSSGLSGIFKTAGFVFVCYGGLLKVASLAEETIEPGKTIPVGMILSLIVVSLIYSLSIMVVVGTLDPAYLTETLTPLADAAEKIFGKRGFVLLNIAAAISFTTAANSGIMSASRYPFALARDKMVPQVFGKLSSRFKTPYISIIATGIAVAVILFLPLKSLVEVASSVLILTYIFTCLSVIILRESRLQNYRPQFRIPLYPAVPIIGLAGFLLFLLGIEAKVLLADMMLLSAGLVVYLLYGRIQEIREYALLHIVERLTAKDITSHMLEDELKEVIRERDEIFKDWFDHLVEDAIVLDLGDEPIRYEELFEKLAEVLSAKTKIEKEKLIKLLFDREKEYPTALTPFTAVPHIVIPGENNFHMVIARSKGGIYFSETAPTIHAVFVLAGTNDRKLYHLKALAAIAQIFQEDDFEQRWLEAKNENALRDIILLSRRKRHN